MANFKFEVCWNRLEERWEVRLGTELYGAYLTKQQAILDAMDAAGDAQQGGHDAQVWDEGTAARIS
jgi:hypothetical protein